MKKLFILGTLLLAPLEAFAQVSALPANQFFASPSASTGKLSPRAMVLSDLPALAFSNLVQVDGANVVGTGANVDSYFIFNSRALVGYDNSLGTIIQSVTARNVVVMVNNSAFGSGDVAATFAADKTATFGDGVIATTHFRNASGVPAASACGTSPTVTANSTNSSGNFTFGTGTPSACTITFANAYPTAAFCTIFPANAAASGATILPYISASSASAFTVTTAVAVASASFNYVCIGK